MNIVVVSMSCCNPALKPQDDRYIAKIREVLDRTGVEARVDLVKATEMIASLRDDQLNELRPLFEKYGAAVAPAMLIDGKLELFGGIPTIEKITEVISRRASNH